MLRYSIKTDWLFYAFVLLYGFLIARMTYGLWFGDGINIFASYSDANGAELLVDANKVYWSKTCFLFLTLFLYALNMDLRLSVGLGAFFWASSLIIMFGVSPVLMTALLVAAALIAQHVMRLVR